MGHRPYLSGFMNYSLYAFYFDIDAAALIFFSPHSMLWKATIVLSRGVSVQYRYFKGCFLEPKVCFLHLVSSFFSRFLSKATDLYFETLKVK